MHLNLYILHTVCNYYSVSIKYNTIRKTYIVPNSLLTQTHQHTKLSCAFKAKGLGTVFEIKAFLSATANSKYAVPIQNAQAFGPTPPIRLAATAVSECISDESPFVMHITLR